MKTILAHALVSTTALAAVSLWGMMHARRMGESSSQIYIHGTPVCVTQRGGEIEAAVGECGSIPDAPEGEGDASGMSPHRFGAPGFELPPWHPPVGSDPGASGGEEIRRIPI